MKKDYYIRQRMKVHVENNRNNPLDNPFQSDSYEKKCSWISNQNAQCKLSFELPNLNSGPNPIRPKPNSTRIEWDIYIYIYIIHASTLINKREFNNNI